MKAKEDEMGPAPPAIDPSISGGPAIDPIMSGEPSEKPTQKDAELLIQLYEIAQTERVARSFLWYYDFIGEAKDPSEIDFKSFLKKHPRGSEGYFKWTAIASFFETVGVLVRNGVLNEMLVFDRWPVEWYWRYLQPLVKSDRDQGLTCDTGFNADNFEWLANRAEEWRSKGQGHANWQSGRSKKS